MIKHVILWQLKEEFSEEEKTKIRQGIKEGLEGLVGVVPGLISARVETHPLAVKSCNADVLLVSELESVEALKAYTVNPAHVEVADTRVRPFTRSRTCMDFEE